MDKYDDVKFLGKGKYGSVFKCKSDRECVAIKMINKANELFQTSTNEIEIHS